MPNRARNMREMVDRHEAIDVSECPRTLHGDYLLLEFRDGMDYCDARSGAWIWTIAEVTRPLPSKMADGTPLVLMPGMFLASVTQRFYTPGVAYPTKCVFLR